MVVPFVSTVNCYSFYRGRCGKWWIFQPIIPKVYNTSFLSFYQILPFVWPSSHLYPFLCSSLSVWNISFKHHPSEKSNADWRCYIPSINTSELPIIVPSTVISLKRKLIRAVKKKSIPLRLLSLYSRRLGVSYAISIPTIPNISQGTFLSSFSFALCFLFIYFLCFLLLLLQIWFNYGNNEETYRR